MTDKTKVKTSYSATYKAKKGAFELRWIDYSKSGAAIKGGYHYGRKQVKVADYLKKSVKERHAIQAQLTALAQELEEKSKLASLSELDKVKDAVEYLRAVKEVCISKTKAEVIKATRIVNDFADWLENYHSGITLDKINTVIAIEYAKWLKAGGKTANNSEPVILSNSTIKTYLLRLGFIFRRVVEAMEDSQIKYRNGFADANNIIKQLPNEEVYKRDTYSVNQSKQLFLFLLINLSNNDNAVSTEKVFKYIAATFFAMVTGWRIADIIYKKWEDYNEEEETLYNLHAKTSKTSGSRTTVKLTDNALKLIKRLKELNGDTPYIFGFTDDEEPEKSRSWYESYYEYFTRRVKIVGGNKDLKRGSHTTRATLTPHSMRSTAISYLKAANVANDSIIQSYVGHTANNEIERRHYDKFSPANYTPCMSYLESLLVPEYMYNIDANKYLKELRKIYLLPIMAISVAFRYCGNDIENTETAAAMQSIYKEKLNELKDDIAPVAILERVVAVMQLEGMKEQLALIKVGAEKLHKDIDKLTLTDELDKDTFNAINEELKEIGLDVETVVELAKERVRNAKKDRRAMYGTTSKNIKHALKLLNKD